MEQNVVKKQPISNSSTENEELRMLMLHNDEVNTFDHVISSLVQICRHDSAQAEQCAFITHYKGKCDVKSGSYEELAPMKLAMIERGLQVTID